MNTLIRQIGLTLLVFFAGTGLRAQRVALEPSAPAASTHRGRLYLKDGSYQIVMSYKVLRDRVRYTSAERGGDTEEVPLELVDLPATRRWEQRQMLGAGAEADGRLDPELAKEEAERAAITPVVAKADDAELRLPLEDSVLALDTFRGMPELVPLAQQSSELNQKTGHGIAKLVVNPASSPHAIVTLRGEAADVQVHVDQPEFFLRVGDAADLPTGAGAITVDTHGAGGGREKGSAGASSRYVILRVDVRQDARVVSSFRAEDLGRGVRQPDLTETTLTALAGGHWVKVTPKEGLLIGEYVLVEVLSDRDLNAGVWDFGVHPRAPENREAQLPVKPRAVRLERRRPE